MDGDRRFYELVERLGYRHSPKGLGFARRDEIYTVRFIQRGIKIGTKGFYDGMALNAAIRENRDLYYAAVIAYEGEEKAVRDMLSSFIFHPDGDAYQVKKKIELMEEWHREGGILTVRDFRRVCREMNRVRRKYLSFTLHPQYLWMWRIAQKLGIEDTFKRESKRIREENRRKIEELFEEYRKRLGELMR